MPLVGDELWNAVEAQAKEWRLACDDKEGQALLAFLTGDPPHWLFKMAKKPSFADELNEFLTTYHGEIVNADNPFHKQIGESMTLTHLNGADTWKELAYALAGEVVDLQGTLDDINNGRDL